MRVPEAEVVAEFVGQRGAVAVTVGVHAHQVDPGEGEISYAANLAATARDPVRHVDIDGPGRTDGAHRDRPVERSLEIGQVGVEVLDGRGAVEKFDPAVRELPVGVLQRPVEFRVANDGIPAGLIQYVHLDGDPPQVFRAKAVRSIRDLRAQRVQPAQNFGGGFGGAGGLGVLGQADYEE